MLIGIYNKSVILTFLGLCFSTIGITMALQGKINIGMMCLILAGVCDSFDGYIANKTKRNEREKQYGVQLDSLVDIVSFGVLPVILMVSLGYTNLYHTIIYIVYLITGVIRLAYFNVTIGEKNFKGIPITFSAILFPVVYILLSVIKGYQIEWIYLILTVLLSIGHIINISIKKPSLKTKIVLFILAIFLIIVYIIRGL